MLKTTRRHAHILSSRHVCRLALKETRESAQAGDRTEASFLRKLITSIAAVGHTSVAADVPTATLVSDHPNQRATSFI